jgi:hypothetical protein
LENTKNKFLLDFYSGDCRIQKIILCLIFAVEKKLPWGVILLLGGGFALSDATEQ